MGSNRISFEHWLTLGLLALAGCAPVTPPPTPAAVAVAEPEPAQWQRIASAEDQDRIARLDSAWTAALGEARSRGFTGAVADEAELLDPAAALPRAAPPPGPYHCRVIKLGIQGKGEGAYRAFPPFFCYVEAEGPLLTIVKQTGSQRPAGRLYPATDQRLIFLGTLALGDEQAPLPYGENPARDMAGVVERVAPFRWRLVIPWPRTESKLDVFELVPVAPSARLRRQTDGSL
ncbi:MAG TPA: DUF4893 domain-containing protein [Allosphingosinicella sp.]|nr:DUF4893 domain-containing protein [Allosphingosinicella sp.]